MMNLTEPDLTQTEVRSPLPAAFGRIEPTAIAFIFARHYLRPSAALAHLHLVALGQCGLRPQVEASEYEDYRCRVNAAEGRR